MKEIVAKSLKGEEVRIGVAALVSRTSWLAGAKLVPPMFLVNELLFSGKARYDHWRQIQWDSFTLDSNEYELLKSELVTNQGFQIVDETATCSDRLTWEVIQTARQTGRSFDEIYPIAVRIELIERLLSMAEDSNEADIVEYLMIKRAEAVEKLN